MAVSVNKVIYDVYRKLNAANSSKNRTLRIVDLVSYINEAYEIWYENRVFENETNEKNTNDLKVFIKKKVPLDCKKVDCDCCLAELPPDHYKTLNTIVKVCGVGECKGVNKEILPKYPQSNDLQTARKNKYTKPNFGWERLLAQDVEGGILIYHDGLMDVNKVCIDYYRKPKRIEAPELVKCGVDIYRDYDNKVISQNVDLEVDATFANRIISDIAVLLIDRDSGNVNQAQSQLNKILNTKNL